MGAANTRITYCGSYQYADHVLWEQLKNGSHVAGTANTRIPYVLPANGQLSEFEPFGLRGAYADAYAELTRSRWDI